MKKYARVEISTEKKIICDTGSINMQIWDNEPYRFTDVFEYYVIMTSKKSYIENMSSDLRSGYQR